MSISPGQAAAALEDIERTERRTRTATGYAAASPYLILWGLVWMAGYGACAVLPRERWGLVWLPLVAVGTLGCIWLGSRGRGQSNPDALGRAGLAALSIGIFVAAVFFVFRPADSTPSLIFPTLIAGLVYSLGGIVARMPRFVWIAAGMVVLIMAGYVAAPAWSAAWAAVAGGGGLVLGGLWLRKV
jgi:FtsH-binding integral membrane protein